VRAPFVIGATLAGVVGIVAFHPHPSSGAATFNSPGTHSVGGSSTNGGVSTTGAPPAAGSAPPAPSSTTTAPTTTIAAAAPGAPTTAAASPAAAPRTATAPTVGVTPPPTVTVAPTVPPPTTTAPPTTAPSGTASGTVTQYRFGSLQVTATVSGGHLTNVTTQVQSSDSRSQQIDNSALPALRSQALSAQSANVQGVSGATYTSQAFRTSLQSALTALGFT